MAPSYPGVRIAMHLRIYMKIHSLNDRIIPGLLGKLPLFLSLLTGYIYSHEASLTTNKISTFNINVKSEVIVSKRISGVTAVKSAFKYSDVTNFKLCF